jgi:hypothetical protein
VLGAAQVLLDGRQVADLQTDVYDAFSEDEGWEGPTTTVPIKRLLCIVPGAFCCPLLSLLCVLRSGV